MHFAFTEEQDELRSTARSFLAHRGALTQAHAAADGRTDDGPATWGQLVEQLELTALGVSELYGGAGATFVEVGIVLEELGRALLPSPYLPTVVAAEILQRRVRADVAGPLLEQIVAGAAATVALDPGRPEPPLLAHAHGDGYVVTGVRPQVLEGDAAAVVLVPAAIDGEIALFAVSRGEGLQSLGLPTLDATRRQSRIALQDAPARRLTAPGEGPSAVAFAEQVLAVALAAEAVGGAARCLETTVAYLQEREQFGRRLGTFQALRHRCADVAAAIEVATSSTYAAVWTVAYEPEELSVLAPLAKAVAAEAFLHAAGESIQLHGGIGFTWEHEAHLYFKRAKSTELLFGSPRTLRRRAAERAGVV